MPGRTRVSTGSVTTASGRQYGWGGLPARPAVGTPHSSVRGADTSGPLLAESPTAVLGAHAVGFYLALHAFYAPEFIIRVVGASIPVVAGLAALLPVLWLLISPQPFRFLQTRIALPYLFLAVWWLLSAVTMSLKGYVPELFQYVVRFHTAPLIVCGLLFNLRLVRKAIVGYGCGFLVTLLLCWKYGDLDIAGRFCIAGTSLENPNDLALNIVLGMTYLLVLLTNGTWLKRLLFSGALLASVYYALKTGSRANFLTLGFVLLIAWKITSAKTRTMLVLGGLAAALIVASLIPRQTWVRLTTFESAPQEELAGNEHLTGAVGSTEARKQLQIRALKLTLQYPVFGVGPKMFVYALNDLMRAEGFRKGTWQVAHNTYLQISAETGIIGFALYVWCVLWCFRTNYRSVREVQRRPGLQSASGHTYALLFASAVFGFGTLFCSVLYMGQLPFLLGLTAANRLALRDAGAWTPAAPAGMAAREPSFLKRRLPAAPWRDRSALP